MEEEEGNGDVYGSHCDVAVDVLHCGKEGVAAFSVPSLQRTREEEEDLGNQKDELHLSHLLCTV